MLSGRPAGAGYAAETCPQDMHERSDELGQQVGLKRAAGCRTTVVKRNDDVFAKSRFSERLRLDRTGPLLDVFVSFAGWPFVLSLYPVRN